MSLGDWKEVNGRVGAPDCAMLFELGEDRSEAGFLF